MDDSVVSAGQGGENKGAKCNGKNTMKILKIFKKKKSINRVHYINNILKEKFI